MRKAGGKRVLLLLLFAVLVIYTFWDNNRIKIVEQEIAIDELADELEGFTILQVTDLHEKVFGKNQKRLVEKINSIDYDVIVFTGDMLDDPKSKNYEPYYSLLDGIGNLEHALFVPGNTDPDMLGWYQDSKYKGHEFLRGMEDRGVEVLESIYSINLGSEQLHIVYFENAILGEKGKERYLLNGSFNQEYQNHLAERLAELSELESLEKKDVVVALNHYPVVDRRIDIIKKDSRYRWPDLDLILAGHYHGGQYRLPFLGAIFVPEAYYDNNGFLPPRDRVKGLWEYNGTKQYVSTGLGSSDAIPFMKFRMFNTPEIDVLTLKKE